MRSPFAGKAQSPSPLPFPRRREASPLTCTRRHETLATMARVAARRHGCAPDPRLLPSDSCASSTSPRPQPRAPARRVPRSQISAGLKQRRWQPAQSRLDPGDQANLDAGSWISARMRPMFVGNLDRDSSHSELDLNLDKDSSPTPD